MQRIFPESDGGGCGWEVEAAPVPYGSYSSALARGPLIVWPPVTSTWPEGSQQAAWRERAVAREAEGDQVWEAGS